MTEPLREFRDAVHALYLAADSPPPEQLRHRMPGSDVPSVAVIREVISGPALPLSVRDVAAVVAVLAPAEVDRVRALWVRAAGHQPPGRPADSLSPVELGVHRAVHGVLPTYVVRPHDHTLREVVAQALAGESGIAMLVSGSSSGKTRACYEALHWRSLDGTLADWRVWPSVHPTDPRRVLAELPEVVPRTVVWLNEAQRYLIEPPAEVREAIAAELRSLLADRTRGPVLVLGTLWPRYWQELTRTPQPGEPDPVDTRLLLDGHGIPVPDTFSQDALTEAATSGDPALVEAASHAEDAAVTQYLAGVPDLLQRYELADQGQKAIVHAAMDARRLGHGEWLPETFLRAAARAFPDARTLRLLDRDPRWFDEALAELTRLGRADTSILVPDGDGRYRLEDYLDQLGRRTRAFDFPPQPFWDAAADHLADANDLTRLAHHSMSRFRLRIATKLFRLAHRADGLAMIADIIADGGDQAGAERLVDKIDSGAVLTDFVERQRDHDRGDLMRDERLLRRAVALGHRWAYADLAILLEQAGDRDEAELVVRQALDKGHWEPVVVLAGCRDISERAEAEALLTLLADAERADAEVLLAQARDHADRLLLFPSDENEVVRYRLSQLYASRTEDEAEADSVAGSYRVFLKFMGREYWRRIGSVDAELQAIQSSIPDMFLRGELAEAEARAVALARKGHLIGCGGLAWLRDEDGDLAGAEALATTAAELGHPVVRAMLATIRYERGDHAGAERCVRHSAAEGHAAAVAILAILRNDESLARKAAVGGDTSGLVALARSSEQGEKRRLALLAVNATVPERGFRDMPDSQWQMLVELYRPHNLLATGLAADGSLETVPASDW